jgi:hypothetical protein
LHRMSRLRIRIMPVTGAVIGRNYSQADGII